ncbi:hypothetical protein [Winogradskyella helgolandensis]|uniref:hypothetical protein n=1 Tax=Winogradskyella helgolandensis TaxID=2697010 RepID=UPI0015BE11FB|nr:hypothetical protein [Winogradskyella helgolandensis]
MESTLKQSLGHKIARAKKAHFTSRGLLNSRYKRIVKYNFKKARKKSIFGIRQRAKSPQLSKLGNRATMILKISVFVAGFALLV